MIHDYYASVSNALAVDLAFNGIPTVIHCFFIHDKGFRKIYYFPIDCTIMYRGILYKGQCMLFWIEHITFFTESWNQKPWSDYDYSEWFILISKLVQKLLLCNMYTCTSICRFCGTLDKGGATGHVNWYDTSSTNSSRWFYPSPKNASAADMHQAENRIIRSWKWSHCCEVKAGLTSNSSICGKECTPAQWARSIHGVSEIIWERSWPNKKSWNQNSTSFTVDLNDAKVFQIEIEHTFGTKYLIMWFS